MLGLNILNFFMSKLIVGFFFNPSTWIVSEDPFADLIKDKDENGERDGREPPVKLQGVHLQALVHARSVRHEDGKAGLKDESKVKDPVGHALGEDGVLAGLADDQVSPLDNHNRGEESSVTGVLKDFPVPVGPLLVVGIFKIIDS